MLHCRRIVLVNNGGCSNSVWYHNREVQEGDLLPGVTSGQCTSAEVVRCLVCKLSFSAPVLLILHREDKLEATMSSR